MGASCSTDGTDGRPFITHGQIAGVLVLTIGSAKLSKHAVAKFGPKAKDVVDSYVVVYHAGEEMRTQTVMNTLTPAWNKRFLMTVPNDTKVEDLSFELMIYDDEKYENDDDYEGEVEVAFADVQLDVAEIVREAQDGADDVGTFEKEITLKLAPLDDEEDPSAQPPEDGEEEEKVTDGELKVKLHFVPAAEIQERFWNYILLIADANDDEELTRAEFDQLLLLATNGDNNTVRKRSAELFDTADADHDGIVKRTELETFLLADHNLQLVTDQLMVAFARHSLNDVADDRPDLVSYDFRNAEEVDKALALASDYSVHGYQQFSVPKHPNDKMRNIHVYDRRTKKLHEEYVPDMTRLIFRVCFQTKIGQYIWTQEKAHKHSEDAKAKWTAPGSASHIADFVEEFSINLDEVRDPVKSFKCFNDFFTRHLRDGARPIAHPETDRVVVSAADCRLLVFKAVSEMTRLWVKGKNFSVSELLMDDAAAQRFEGGACCIFRLAPQDYHRFHMPVTGTLTASPTMIDGILYTVNPIAVQSEYDIFTENKRAVYYFDTPENGLVAIVAVGAVEVGSIVTTAEVGKRARKGDELGYFQYGGSTLIMFTEPSAKLVWDADLAKCAQNKTEVLVKMGEKIGTWKPVK